MAKPPRRPEEPLLPGLLLVRIVLVSLILLCGTFGLFLFERAQGASLETARTVAVNTLVMFETIYLFNTRYLNRSALSLAAWTGNRIALLAVAGVVLCQLLFTYAWPLQALFASQAIDAAAWGRILLVATSVFFVVELEKWLLHSRPRAAAASAAGRGR